MKRILFVFGLILIGNFLHAQQDWRLKIEDDWFLEHGMKSLKVGDKMPDIPLGKVLNNYTGKTKFSDFKGKLLILDFWNTACKSCIAAFPKMEKIQQEFGDKIQIVLVNLSETEQDISKMKNAKGAGDTTRGIKFPNLPGIVLSESLTSEEQFYSTGLGKYFRTRGVPFHVWIDGNGIIKVMGDQANTYPEKINDLLAGKPVYSMNSISTTPFLSVDRRKPAYYNFLADFKQTPAKWISVITPYNNEISATSSGAHFKDIIDSSAKTIRETFVNYQLLDIYLQAPFFGFEGGQHKDLKTLYSSPLDNYSFVVFSNAVDTFRYTSRYFEDKNRREGYKDILKDKDVIKSTYCYEQVVPLGLQEKTRRQYMLDDLNRYFGQAYGIVAQIEKRTIPVYLLVRTSDKDKIGGAVQKDNSATVPQNKQILNKKRVNSENLQYLFTDVIKTSFSFDELVFKNKMKGQPFLIVNATGWDNSKKLDLIVPEYPVNSISDLKKFLNYYDLDIIEGSKEISFLVFKQLN